MKNLISVVLTLVFILMVAYPANAKIKVVTTLPSFADIAKNVGGDEVSVVSLTKGTQDPHFVDAKPDLMLDLNRADLLVRAGLGLEDGWLPPLLTGARNSKIQNGSDGDLDVSTTMVLKDVPKGAVDRSMGDVHPGGNPHYMLDPNNGVVLAKALAKKLGKINAAKATDFEKRAADYSQELEKRIAQWKKDLQSIKDRRYITYHRSWIYFSSWAHFEEAEYVEPKPGIPPSPEHAVKLIGLMKEKKIKLILMEPFYPKGSAEEVANKAGAHLLVLPTEVQAFSEVKSYFDIFEVIIKKMKETL